MLERVAGHATNIVENIYYVETGEMRQLAREEHMNGDHDALLGDGASVDGTLTDGKAATRDHHHDENIQRDADVPTTLITSVDELPHASNHDHNSSN